jgi:serine/threonine protein phosphatase PrpC
MTWCLTKLAVLSLAVLGFAAAASAGNSQPDEWRQGIWKSTPVPKNPDAQFDKQDPFGLAIGKHIHTHCSIYWVDPGNGKLYCFNSGTSRAYFIEKPQYYIKKAKAFLRSEESHGNP